MRMVFALVLFVGIALAGAAVYITQGYISQIQTALAKERELRVKTGPLVEVFVVNKDKLYGQVLKKEDVQVISKNTPCPRAYSAILKPCARPSRTVKSGL